MNKATVLNTLYSATPIAGAPEAAPNVPQSSFFTDLIRIAYGTQNDGPGTAIIFTGIDRGCGVSYTCCSVAAELAARGGKVLLADAEAIATLAGVSRPGAYCERVEPGRVWVLGMNQVRGAGLPAVTASAPVVNTSPTTALRLLQPEFSFLVIDAPAISVSGIALTLSGIVQGVIFVAQAGQTVARELSDAQRSFTSLGARVLGTVYNAT